MLEATPEPEASEPTGDALLEAELEAELTAVTSELTVTPELGAIAGEATGGEKAKAAGDDAEFAGMVREAIERFDGQILFELDHDPAFGHVAAVQMGDGDARQFAMVIKPDDGGPLRVEPAAESEHPLAAIMQSYAGLVDAWKKAA
ncbi:MAG: hypothetical protein AB7I79_07670 [Rhizobiaceae bacterium]